MSATPRPWAVSAMTPAQFDEVREDGGRNPVGFVYMPALPERSEQGRLAIARCELIVRAVNSHAALVAALEGLVSERHAHPSGCSCPWCFARAALAAAKGDAP